MASLPKRNQKYPEKKIAPIAIFLFLAFLSSFLSKTIAADTISENLTTRTYFTSGTAILNQALNIITAPMQIAGWQLLGPCGANTNTAIDYGDGRHGSFDPTTYTLFGSYAGSVVSIDTDRFPILYVTNFTLNVGDTIQPIGNNPLIIKSLTDITINGTVDCSGGAGQAAAATPAVTTTGGSARCGGGAGGNGGSTSVAATAGKLGEIQTAPITAGTGATSTNGAGGGGGGGFFCNTCAVLPACGGTGANGAANGGGAALEKGIAGINSMDGGFTLPGGGAGGGGGAPSATFNGGGGGAGGGRIELIAFRNIVLGAGSLVTAVGGAGGASASNSGGGGGGAGGSIKIHAGQTLTVNATARVHVLNGVGGTSGTGSAGGNGSWGRVWVIDKTGAPSGPPQVDAADISLLLTGSVLFQTGAFSMTSSKYDLGNYHTTVSNLTSSTTNPASGTLTVSAAGSNGSGFQVPASIAALNGSRFVAFEIDLNNTNATTPIELNSYTLTYTPGSQNAFNYASGCGSIDDLKNGKIPQQEWPAIIILLVLLILPILTLLGIKFFYQRQPKVAPSM